MEEVVSTEAVSMNHVALDSNWTLQCLGPAAAGDKLAAVPDNVQGKTVPAIVPGCVHTDLIAAGLLADPYISDNELQQFWIGRCNWRYTCTFELTDEQLQHDRLDLACDGLDTLATLTLNGQVIGRARNMHRQHRFDLRPAARAGHNELVVTFDAPVTYIWAQEEKLGPLPHTGNGSNRSHPFNQLRKMSCNFGWDWGPDVATCGIWRSIRIEAWNTVRIASVRPLVTAADKSSATVKVFVDLEHAAVPSADVPDSTVTLTSPDGKPLNATRNGDAYTVTVSTPQLWWPIGHGEQPLYNVSVTLAPTGEQWQGRIGLRTSSLQTTPDARPVGAPVPDKQGESMTLIVNGKPIYAKGADWIPDDCFPSRMTPQRYHDRVSQARDANMNMIRVWGGGFYEDKAFFDACDELGVMVWMDFMFACAGYTEDEPMWSEVEAEAEYNIKRLSPHASLVLWNGNNENFMGVFDWAEDWRALRSDTTRTWGLAYYLSLFPKLLKKLDPTRPYWPGSPYSGTFDRPPNANEFGNRHIWDVWHGTGDYHNYLAHYPRMATEFGFHGPPTWPTLADAIPDKHRQWNDPIVKLHNKNSSDKDGQEHVNLRMADDFVPPTGSKQFDDWLYLAQVMQARALEIGVTWFRALFPWNSGALFWQLNDCYPVASWSAIDSQGRLKPLWYASRRFFADRLVTLKPRRATSAPLTDPLAVYLHNDHDTPWKASCVLRQMSLDGKVLAEHTQSINIAPRSLQQFDVPDNMLGKPETFLVASAEGGERGFWWFAADKKLPYPVPAFDAELTDGDGQQTLTLHARSILRDVCVFADRLHRDAMVSDQFNTLLPGERLSLRIQSPVKLSKADLIAPPVLNMANRFGRA